MIVKEKEELTTNDIKKGLNIYLYYWTIPIFILFILINYFTRNIKIEALDITTMISIVSFLFGFIVTITFSMLLTKTSSLKDSLAEETGRLTSLYLLSKHLGENFHKIMREIVDRYTIKTLKNYKNYDVGREELYSIYDKLDYAELKTEKQHQAINSFLYILGEWEPLRERLEYLTNRRIEWSLKFTNYLLGTILIVLLFLNRNDTFTNSIFVILSVTVVFIFFLLEDFDNLRIGDYTYNISNSEQLFDLIGKERYYPQSILSRVKLKKGNTYRIGILDKKTHEEKIFRVTYSKVFNSKINNFIGKLKPIKKS